MHPIAANVATTVAFAAVVVDDVVAAIVSLTSNPVQTSYKTVSATSRSLRCPGTCRRSGRENAGVYQFYEAYTAMLTNISCITPDGEWMLTPAFDPEVTDYNMTTDSCDTLFKASKYVTSETTF